MKPLIHGHLFTALAVATIWVHTWAPGSAPDESAPRAEPGASARSDRDHGRARATPGLVFLDPQPTATPSSVRDAVSVADLLREYLAMEFGTTTAKAPWYDRVRRVTVGLHTAVVYTDLSSRDGDRVGAEAICQAVSRFSSSTHGRRVTPLDVEVYGVGEQLLARYDDAQVRALARSTSRLTQRSVPRRAPPILPPTPTPGGLYPNLQPGSD